MKVPVGRGRLKPEKACSGMEVTPQSTPATVTVRMPMIMEPGTRRHMSMAIRARPPRASRASGLVRGPRVTKVEGSATTMPQFLRPMKAMKAPMPTTMAYFRSMGTASMIICRTRVTVSSMKNTPEMKTAPRPVCQL